MGKAGDRGNHRTKAQHYVAQFYLRGFANAKEMMFCYDKVARKSHPTSTKAAAQEPYFYEIVPGTTTEAVPVNAIENALSDIEGIGASLLKDLIKSADEGKISHELLEHFCSYVAVQWMRTKTHRDTLYEMATKGLQTIADDLTRLNFPGVTPPKVAIGEESLPALHAEQMLDPEMIAKVSDSLQRHILIVGINDTEHPFYTSDHPVVRNPNCRDAARPYVGFNDPGIEFAFPLDNRHILLVLERSYFKEFRKYDASAMPMTPELVHKYNALQVRRSCQRIFCVQDDFELARQICTDEPGICDPNRPRVIAGSTPMIDTGPTEKKNYTYVIALE